MGQAPCGPGGSNKRQASKITIADWVTEVAVSVGLTIPDALKHSIPQLTMMSHAAARIRSGQALLDLRVNVTATAAGNGNKGGKTMLNDLQRDLRRRMQSV